MDQMNLSTRNVKVSPNGVYFKGSKLQKGFVLDPTENLLFGMELSWIVLISVCSLLIIFACLVGVAICLCRLRPVNNGANGNPQNINGNSSFNQVQRE